MTDQKKYNILILEDSTTDAELVEQELRKGGVLFLSRRTDNREDFTRALEEFSPHLILSDYMMPTFDGFSALKIVREKDTDLPFLFVSGTLGEEAAVTAMKAGAHDFLVKGNLSRLVPAVMRELKEAEIREARKKTLVELSESERRYTELVSQAPDPIITLDTQGFLRSANPAAEQASGYSVEDLIGKPFIEMGIVAPDSAGRVIKEFALTMTGQERPPFELEIVRKDQSLASFEVHSRPIFHESRVCGVQVIFRDITTRKHLEAQLLQSQKMEAVGQLAGGIAHDFNNLLTVINGYSEIQLQSLPADSQVREDFEEILKAGKLAKVLTSQLLAFSRRQIFEPTIVNLNDVIGHMDKMLRRLIRENIELVLLPAPDLAAVKVDPSSMEQVLTNLVVNAGDAMPLGGKLIIETQNVNLDEEYTRQNPAVMPGEYVLLAVSDTGVGMKEEVQKRIFEPFFTTKENGKGTGLGLATTYGIVKQSGGLLNVYSELGHGSTFKIYLPRVYEETGSSLTTERSKDLPCGTETVLVVEDEPLVRNFTCRVLRQQGYEVLEASNGKEASRLADQPVGRRIELLITDIVMPEVGGKELAGRLKTIWPAIRVIFTSGYTESIANYREVVSHSEGFLQKPFSPHALAIKVRDVLDNKKG